MYVQRNTEARSCNHCCRGKSIHFTEYKCVFVDLDNKYAQRMRRLVFSPLACLAYPYFSKSSQKQQVFRENVIEHKMFVLIFSTTFV